MLEGIGKYLSEPIFIVFGYVSHPNGIKIDLVSLMQWAAAYQAAGSVCRLLSVQSPARQDLQLVLRSRTPGSRQILPYSPDEPRSQLPCPVQGGRRAKAPGST